MNAINLYNISTHPDYVRSLNYETHDKATEEDEILRNDQRLMSREEQIEKINIKRVLDSTNGDEVKAASLLNLSYMSLVTKITKYNISFTPANLLSVYV